MIRNFLRTLVPPKWLSKASPGRAGTVVMALWLSGLLACKPYDPINKYEKPLDHLPPETQVGAGTFGCLINGKLYTPGGPVSGWGKSNFTWYYETGYPQSSLVIKAWRRYEDEKYEYLNIQVSGMDSVGIYPVYQYSYPPSKRSNMGYTTLNKCFFETTHRDVTASGYVEITHFSKKAIAGRFEFTFFPKSGDPCHSDTLRITKGRFDL